MTDSILITGGARGIGRATVLCAIGVYDIIYILDRDKDAGIQTTGQAQRHGGNATFLCCDIANYDGLKQAFEFIASRGGLTSAVNCAGILGAKAKVGDYPLETWQRVLDVNLTGTFVCMGHELGLKTASIVNVSSVVTDNPGAYPVVAYAVSKAGIDTLTRWTAMEHPNTFVGAICPTDQDTTMNRELTGQYHDDYEHVERLSALGETIIRMTQLRYDDADHDGKLSGRVLHQDEWARLLKDRPL